MRNDELSRIERTIDIDAPPERVWRALTDPAQLSAWFQVTIEGTFAAGRDVWMTSVHPQHAGVRFRVWVVDMTPPRRLVWKWHPGEVDAKVDYAREHQTTVTFTLEPAASGTRLTVVEDGFNEISLERRAKAYQDNSQGWTEVIVWLKSYAEAKA